MTDGNILDLKTPAQDTLNELLWGSQFSGYMIDCNYYLKPSTKQTNDMKYTRSIHFIMPVKNGGQTLIEVAKEWATQFLPDGWKHCLVVIDDGSSDGETEKLALENLKNLHIVYHSESRGRASAINSGLDITDSDYVGIIDADCKPINQFVVSEYIQLFELGKEIVFGGIQSSGNSFWEQYFDNVCQSRLQQLFQGNLASMSTQNCAMKSSLAKTIGGFDERFCQYGFEDRDFLLRLAESRTVNWAYNPRAKVLHIDKPYTMDVCRKMYKSGRFSSHLYSKHHEQQYKHSKYGKSDASLHKSIRYVALIIRPILKRLIQLANLLIESKAPWPIKKFTGLTISGICYSIGTYDAIYEKDIYFDDI